MAVALVTAALTFTPIAHHVPTPCPDGMTETWGVCVTDMARRWIPAAYLGKEAAHRDRTGPHVVAPPPTETPLVELVAAYFPIWAVDDAMSVIGCETGYTYDPNSRNTSSGASGLFQHMPRYWADRSAKAGWAGYSIFDPEANVAVAAWLWGQTGTWQHWTCKP